MVHCISRSFDISINFGSLHIPDLWQFTWSWLIAYSWPLVYYLLIQWFIAYLWPLIFHSIVVHCMPLSFDFSLEFCSLHIIHICYITYWFDRSLHIPVLWYFAWVWFIGYACPSIFHLFFVHCTSSTFDILPFDSIVQWISLSFDISLDVGSLDILDLWFFTWQVIHFISLTFHTVPIDSMINRISLTFDILLDCGPSHVLDLWYFT